MNRWQNPVRLVQGPHALDALPALVAEATPSRCSLSPLASRRSLSS